MAQIDPSDCFALLSSSRLLQELKFNLHARLQLRSTRGPSTLQRLHLPWSLASPLKPYLLLRSLLKRGKFFFFLFTFILYLFVGGVQVSQGTYVKLLRVDSLLPPCELEYQTQVKCLVANAFSCLYVKPDWYLPSLLLYSIQFLDTQQ